MPTHGHALGPAPPERDVEGGLGAPLRDHHRPARATTSASTRSTRRGFELMQRNRGRTELARHIDPDAKWRAPEVEDPRLVLHDLHAAAWLFAARAAAAARRARRLARPAGRPCCDVPRREGARPVGQADARAACRSAPASTSPTWRSTSSRPSSPTSPSSSTSRSAARPRRVDLLVELDRTGRASSNVREVPPLRRADQRLGALAPALQDARRAARSSCSSSRTTSKARQFLRGGRHPSSPGGSGSRGSPRPVAALRAPADLLRLRDRRPPGDAAGAAAARAPAGAQTRARGPRSREAQAGAGAEPGAGGVPATRHLGVSPLRADSGAERHWAAVEQVHEAEQT